jgi:folate-binding protein YgfZ
MKNKNIFLNNRTVLKISGSNYLNFLNNILTSDMTKLKSKEITPSALLTPQGRILFDMLISLGPLEKINDLGYVFIECEVTQADDLFKKINMYNLRKEVIVEKTRHKVSVTNNPKNYPSSLIDKRFFEISIGRIYSTSKVESIDLEFQSINQEKQNWYDSLRYIHCIPEGPKEIISNVSLPLEINLDLLGGISFEKGCFIGQEVNARVKWKGLVKKKYIPIILKNKDLSTIRLKEHGKNGIYLNNDEIGQIISITYDQINNRCNGIAIIKLIYLYKFEEDTSLECDFEESKVNIKFPKYLLPLPRKSSTS